MSGFFRNVFPRYDASGAGVEPHHGHAAKESANSPEMRPWSTRKKVTVPLVAIVLLFVVAAIASPPRTTTVITNTASGDMTTTTSSPRDSSTSAVPPTTVFPDAVTKGALCRFSGALPDHACTPGALNPAVTQANIAQTICSAGYTTTVRPVSSAAERLKTQVALAYGLADPPSTYQGDHLIPLELGGAADDVANFWDQPNKLVLGNGSVVTSDQKDALENDLRAKVCAGAMSLVDAQRQVAADWLGAWAAAGRPGAASTPLSSTTTTKISTTTSTARTVTTAPSVTVTTVPRVTIAPATTSAPTKPTNCPHGSYVNVSGNSVCSPYASPTAPAGATAICNDGTYSMSQHHQGTCSGHGGVDKFF